MKEDRTLARSQTRCCNQSVISTPVRVLHNRDGQIRSTTFEIQMNVYSLVNNSNINLYEPD
jgi:hypothetical protein